MQLLFRFVVGGIVVSFFAVIGDALKPKSFAGIFGAAPSVALATLGLTIVTNGKDYAAVEARSMILGAIAFFFYACVCTWVMAKHKLPVARVAIGGLVVWLGFALGSWLVFLK